jgi:hypothetical protein
MTKEMQNLLDQYWDKFGRGFPLYHVGLDLAEKHIKECLEKNISAEELDPDLYGPNEGVDI